MKRSRFSEEQIIVILKQQESGIATADVCREHGISSATFYKWKAKFGGLEVSDTRKLKALEDENAKRDAAAHLCKEHEVSQRRACSVLGVDRSSVRYRSVRPNDAELREAMKAVAAERRRVWISPRASDARTPRMAGEPEEAEAPVP